MTTEAEGTDIVNIEIQDIEGIGPSRGVRVCCEECNEEIYDEVYNRYDYQGVEMDLCKKRL